MKSQHRFVLRRAACVLLLGLASIITTRANAQTKATGNPPVIDEQPFSRNVSDGGHVTLSAVARGTAPLSYEWRKDGLPLPTAPHITGNASAVLNIEPAGTNDSGGYMVVITNTSGSITSSLATVTFNQLFMQITVLPARGGVIARVFSLLGDVCRVESQNSIGGPWMTNAYLTNFFGTPPEVFLSFAGIGNFFRARFDHMLPILYSTGVGTMRAYGKLNQVWRFDGSGDLQNWVPLETVTNSRGWVQFGDPRDFIPQHQFYRIAPP